MGSKVMILPLIIADKNYLFYDFLTDLARAAKNSAQNHELFY